MWGEEENVCVSAHTCRVQNRTLGTLELSYRCLELPTQWVLGIKPESSAIWVPNHWAIPPAPRQRNLYNELKEVYKWINGTWLLNSGKVGLEVWLHYSLTGESFHFSVCSPVVNYGRVRPIRFLSLNNTTATRSGKSPSKYVSWVQSHIGTSVALHRANLLSDLIGRWESGSWFRYPWLGLC